MRGPRAQADRKLYAEAMQRSIRETANLSVIEGEADVARATLRLHQERAEAEAALRAWRDLEGERPADPLVRREPQIRDAERSLAAAEAQLRRAKLDLDRTVVRAPFAARVRSAAAEVGQVVAAGQRVAELFDLAAVEVRLPQDMGVRWPAQLSRSTPSAAKALPSAVLGQHGGGEFAVDPRDQQGLRTIESVFEFELQLPTNLPFRYLGSRVHVRFEHPAEPVGGRVWRALRRGFLSTFEV